MERAPGDVGLRSFWLHDAGVLVEGTCRVGERYVALDASGWLGIVLVDRERPVTFVSPPFFSCDAHWLEGGPRPPEDGLTWLLGPTFERWPRVRVWGAAGALAPVTTAWMTTTEFDVDGDGVADVQSRLRGCGGPDLDSDQVEIRVRTPLGAWRVTERDTHLAMTW